MIRYRLPPKSIVLLEQKKKKKWAKNWAKEEPGQKSKEQSFQSPNWPQSAPFKKWITPMITFPGVDNEQPWAWQRKATILAGSPNLPGEATNTLIPP